MRKNSEIIQCLQASGFDTVSVQVQLKESFLFLITHSMKDKTVLLTTTDNL